LLPDGKILYADAQLKRLNPNGSADETFTSILPEYPDFSNKRIAEITVQPNGKILIGGTFLKLNGENHNSIARLNRNGTLDSSFRTQVPRWRSRDAEVLSISMQTDGKILFGGFFGVVTECCEHRWRDCQVTFRIPTKRRLILTATVDPTFRFTGREFGICSKARLVSAPSIGERRPIY
jgi:uncharacterized delta-60 repeat protein